MTMKLLERLYNRGRKMSTRQVLNTNDLTLKLTAQQNDLKEIWRKDQKTLFGKAMQAEYEYSNGNLRHRFC
ncbi:hypothetical protein [uncultured Eubacterium sp.]|uniref:hypothetical protein n=1 Tax=uncultured Eubacterium sp. TaxID=165185 RepID=UPI0025E1123F|nr:hypothetical protein [uncultured Eubacterium sp.]